MVTRQSRNDDAVDQSAGRRRLINSDTVIPIGVALSIIAGVVAAYVTFKELHSSLIERVSKLEGQVNGTNDAVNTVLGALKEAGKEIYRRRVNVLSLLEVELGRIESHLETWKAPSWSDVEQSMKKPESTAALRSRLPTGYPPMLINVIGTDSAVRGLPNTDVVLALDEVASELAKFNTFIGSTSAPPPGLLSGMGDPGRVPVLAPGRTKAEHEELIKTGESMRDSLRILVKRLRAQVNTVRAEAKAQG